MNPTPDLSRRVCPGCEPLVEIREITETGWCLSHAPTLSGSADAEVPPGYALGIGDAEAADCRAIQRLIR